MKLRAGTHDEDHRHEELPRPFPVPGELLIRQAHLSVKAEAVKIADKTCNFRDMISSPPHWWPLERRKIYFEWGRMVIDGVKGRWPELEAAFDHQYRKGLLALSNGGK